MSGEIEDQYAFEPKEAVRLERLCRRTPIGTIIILVWLTATVLSAVVTIIAHGPANAIP